MTREDIIRMAREVGAIHIHGRPNEFAIVGNDSIKAFAALVSAAEREACAKCVEEKAKGYEERAAQPKDVRDINPEVARIAVLACGQLAAAIRARGQA
jgi:predicted DNA-binding WGR domain protein